jgi:hypothetical protein
MKLKFTDNYNLFVIYLVLNLSGYNDENNPKGMHPIRKNVRRCLGKYKKDDEAIKSVKKLLKKFNYNAIAFTSIFKREHPRTKNLTGLNEALLLIKKFENRIGLKNFYKKHYLPNLNNIINNKKFKHKLKKYQNNISDFVEIKTDWEISVVVNFLDAYWRGSNYRLSNSHSIVATGPDDKIEIVNWHNIVHEALHCILRLYFEKAKKTFSPKLIKIIKQKTLDKDYRGNTPMHQIEEAFVRAFTPLIMNENRPEYWNYLKDKFPLSRFIYNILKQKLIKGKIKFNQNILNQILKEIENV